MTTDATTSDNQVTTTADETTSGYDSTTTGPGNGDTETSDTGESTTGFYTTNTDETTSGYEETTATGENTTSDYQNGTETGETTSGYEETTTDNQESTTVSEDNSTNTTPTWDPSTDSSPESSISSFISWISIVSDVSSSSDPPCGRCNCDNHLDQGHALDCTCGDKEYQKRLPNNRACCKALLTPGWTWPPLCNGNILIIKVFPAVLKQRRIAAIVLTVVTKISRLMVSMPVAVISYQRPNGIFTSNPNCSANKIDIIIDV